MFCHNFQTVRRRTFRTYIYLLNRYKFLCCETISCKVGNESGQIWLLLFGVQTYVECDVMCRMALLALEQENSLIRRHIKLHGEK